MESNENEEKPPEESSPEKISTYGFYRKKLAVGNKKKEHFIIRNKKDFKRRNTKKIFHKNPFGLLEHIFYLLNPNAHFQFEISSLRSFSILLIFLLVPFIYNVVLNFEQYYTHSVENFSRISKLHENLNNITFIDFQNTEEYISNTLVSETLKLLFSNSQQKINANLISFSKNTTFFLVLFSELFLHYIGYLILALFYFFVILFTLIFPKILLALKKKNKFKLSSFNYEISLKHLVKAFNLSSVYLSIHFCFGIKELILFILSLAIFMFSVFISYFTLCEEEPIELEEVEGEN